MLSTEKQIYKSITNHKRGKIFFPSHFSKFGSSTAIRQALKRLEDKEVLIRLAKGIYLFPKEHEVFGVILPPLEDIAIAIAKRDKARIIPTGAHALNKLGLSTQVPMNIVYLTDGTPRIVKINSGSSTVKIAGPKLLSAKNDTNVLVIQALREIGKDNITPEIKTQIYHVLQNVDQESLIHDMKLAPVWISEIMKESIKDLNRKDERMV